MFADGLFKFDFGSKDVFQLALVIPLESEKFAGVTSQGGYFPNGVHAFDLLELLRRQHLPQLVFMQEPTQLAITPRRFRRQQWRLAVARVERRENFNDHFALFD